MRIYCFILFIYLSIPLFSQETSLRFRQLSPEGGFSYSAIFSIEQDYSGVIWFGTKNGLHRHDSQNIKKFTHVLDDANSLIDNRINVILKNENKLWVATEGGLCYYDHYKNIFIPFPLHNTYKQKADDNIISMVFDQEGKLWIISNLGLGVVDLENHLVHRINLKEKVSPKKLYIDKNNKIWLTTAEGYLFWSENPYDEFNLFGYYDIKVRRDQVWIAYHYEGVDCVGMDGELIEFFEHSEKIENSLPDNMVRKLHIDKDDRLWIGTFRGILLIDPDGSRTVLNHEKYSHFPHNSIFEIFEDKNEGIWIGSWSGGLSYYNKYDNVFHHYKHDLSGNSLSNNVVSGFTEEQNGNIWISTESGGLNYFDRQNNTFSSLTLDLNGNSVYNFIEVSS